MYNGEAYRPTHFSMVNLLIMILGRQTANRIPLLGLIGLLGYVGGCFWTPQVETTLHDSASGTVSLLTIDDKTLQVDHPVDIKTTTMAQVLRGTHRFRDRRLVEGLVSGDAEPKPIFSRAQISFLAPLLSSALEQATSEEQVFFQCTAEKAGAPPIEGKMLVHNSTLFLTWKESLSKPKVLAKQRHKGGSLPDPSMPQDHTIMFFPREAIRGKDASTVTYLKRLGENTIPIDYQVLAGLPKASFDIPELQDRDDDLTPRPVRTSDDPNRPGEPGASPRDSQSDSTTDASEEIRELKEKMEQLQKEMGEQQEELERLKKEKP